MSRGLKYVPIFRGRMQEQIVLRSFDFGSEIYPYLEIIKELDRQPRKPKDGVVTALKSSKVKKFEDIYRLLIANINADKVFVDLPVHLNANSKMAPETILFLRTIVKNRSLRTEYIKKFIYPKNKIIPVITTYFNIANEPNTILLQAEDLRKDFELLAFRTFQDSFFRDISQIEEVCTTTDFVIMDWDETPLDLQDDAQRVINARLKTLKATVIVHRNPIPQSLKYKDLVQDEVIESINNGLIYNYKDFYGSAFSDYAGIKKGNINTGGTINPGFWYYDAVRNEFYGYKGDKKELSEFETTIVPDVIASEATQRMLDDQTGFLNEDNAGWKILNDIDSGEESGKNPGKFKKIGMLHYLHCIKAGIENGDFDHYYNQK